MLTTPYRKRQHAKPPALDLFSSDTPDNTEVESPSAESTQNSFYTISDEDIAPGKVEEVATTAKREMLKLKEEPPPDPFILPGNHRPDVEVALKSGKMTAETRKTYLSQVAAAIFTKKRYPTREEFQRVALDIVRRYPFMESPVPGSTKTVSCKKNLFHSLL